MALTVSQIREHVGAMFQFGLNNAAFLAKGGLSFDDFVLWAKEYRLNGSLGTLADRTEAMRAFVRFLYNKMTGLDPDANPHYFAKHWINDRVPGEAVALGETGI